MSYIYYIIVIVVLIKKLTSVVSATYSPRVQLVRGSGGEDRVISVIEEEDVILQSEGFVFFLENIKV